MDSIEVGCIALMSIHPQYANAIVEGTKRVEFRKRPLARNVTHVIVYATAPVKGNWLGGGWRGGSSFCRLW